MLGLTPDEIVHLLTLTVTVGFLATVTTLALWLQR